MGPDAVGGADLGQPVRGVPGGIRAGPEGRSGTAPGRADRRREGVRRQGAGGPSETQRKEAKAQWPMILPAWAFRSIPPASSPRRADWTAWIARAAKDPKSVVWERVCQ